MGRSPGGGTSGMGDAVAGIFCGGGTSAASGWAFGTANGAGGEASAAGAVYAARNVLAFFPEVADCWRRPPLPELLAAVLGSAFGLVRALWFDKPPDRTWSLPWHKDLTIAVRRHGPANGQFSKPTV